MFTRYYVQFKDGEILGYESHHLELAVNHSKRSDDLDSQDYAEADKQRDAEETELKKRATDQLIRDMYTNSL